MWWSLTLTPALSHDGLTGVMLEVSVESVPFKGEGDHKGRP